MSEYELNEVFSYKCKYEKIVYGTNKSLDLLTNFGEAKRFPVT